MIQSTKGPQLAMISIPWQEYDTPMSPADALMHGTVFCNLAQNYTPIASMQPAQNMNMMGQMNMMQMQNMNMQKKR